MTDAIIGSIMAFAPNYAVEDWLPCDGRSMVIADNIKLYAIIGEKYGTDSYGKTFKLPNIVPLAATRDDGQPAPISYYICLEGMFPERPD